MESKKISALFAGAKAFCSLLFIAVAVLSVSVRAAPALKQEAVFDSFASLSAIGPPAPTEPPDEPEPSAPPDDVAEPEPEKTLPSDADGYEIVPVDISLSDGSGSILFKNETDYTFDTQALLDADAPIHMESETDPIVLVLHTHATESYAQEGAEYVYDTRSSDPEKNMIAVGKVITDTLCASGVPALHCETMHDEKSYNASYSLSCDSVKKYLKDYPSIRYILDVHRDAIQTADGGMAKPVTQASGSDLAQLMLVVGTDKGGADHPDWKTNLTVAVKLQERLISFHESLMRPVNVRTASFNQQYAPGSLLLEVGSCANTLSEAKESAKIFAKIFASFIQENE